MSRPQQNHADLGLVANDQTPFITKAPEARPARTASEAIDHTPTKEHILTIVAHHQTDLHDVEDLSDIAPAPTATDLIESFNAEHAPEPWNPDITAPPSWAGTQPTWANELSMPSTVNEDDYKNLGNTVWMSEPIRVPVLSQRSRHSAPNVLGVLITQGVRSRAPRVEIDSLASGYALAKLEIPEARALAAALTLLADIAEAA